MGTATLAPGQLVNLGAGVWSVGASVDIIFEYVDVDNQFYTGQVELFGADFDQDGDIDGSDFLAWQIGFGISFGAVLADGDADADSQVNSADGTIWMDQFGTTTSADNTVILSLGKIAIPEPATNILMVLTVLLLGSRWRRLF